MATLCVIDLHHLHFPYKGYLRCSLWNRVWMNARLNDTMSPTLKSRGRSWSCCSTGVVKERPALAISHFSTVLSSLIAWVLSSCTPTPFSSTTWFWISSSPSNSGFSWAMTLSVNSVMWGDFVGSVFGRLTSIMKIYVSTLQEWEDRGGH